MSSIETKVFELTEAICHVRGRDDIDVVQMLSENGFEAVDVEFIQAIDDNLKEESGKRMKTGTIQGQVLELAKAIWRLRRSDNSKPAEIVQMLGKNGFEDVIVEFVEAVFGELANGAEKHMKMRQIRRRVLGLTRTICYLHRFGHVEEFVVQNLKEGGFGNVPIKFVQSIYEQLKKEAEKIEAGILNLTRAVCESYRHDQADVSTAIEDLKKKGFDDVSEKFVQAIYDQLKKEADKQKKPLDDPKESAESKPLDDPIKNEQLDLPKESAESKPLDNPKESAESKSLDEPNENEQTKPLDEPKESAESKPLDDPNKNEQSDLPKESAESK